MKIKGQRESASGDLNAGIARVARARSSAERRIKTNEALGNEKPSCHGESGNTGERIQLGQPRRKARKCIPGREIKAYVEFVGRACIPTCLFSVPFIIPSSQRRCRNRDEIRGRLAAHRATSRLRYDRKIRYAQLCFRGSAPSFFMRTRVTPRGSSRAVPPRLAESRERNNGHYWRL